MPLNPFFQTLGVAAGGLFVLVLLWSALCPAQRIWPPQHYNRFVALITWTGTLAIFCSALWLGITGWGTIALPDWTRFGLGLPAVILGTLRVWPAAFRVGFDQTSGAEGDLMTTGLYRYSRHPQYVADILMLAGWGALSASAPALPVIAASIAALIAAPFAEEPWLRETYGDAYRTYQRGTSRFIGFPRKTTS